MDSSNGIMPVFPINGTGDGMFGGNSFMYIFGLLILLGLFNGGFGGFGNNGFANAIGYENLATSNEVQRGFDNQNSMANQREILSAVNSGTAQAVAATNQTFHDTLGIIQNRYDELARDIASLAVGQANQLAKSSECCCETKQLIMQNDYNGAMRDAATNANLTAQIQSVKDMIAQDKIDALQSQVSQLQLQSAMCGVVRYPTNTYYAVPAPCYGFGNGCGCGNNI